MIPTRVVAAPGVRTIDRPGWRLHLGIAVAVVVGRPQLWLIGALGFALRGGIVLLTLPILVLPTPVEVRLMLGSSIASTGLTEDFWATVAAGASICAAGLIALLLALARLEIEAFDRFARDPETGDLRGWRPMPVISALKRRRLLGWTFAIQALGVLALVISAVPLASAIGPAILDEVLRPSSNDGIYLRVLERVIPQLTVLAAAVLLVEMLSALATRRVLMRGYGLAAENRSSRRFLLGAPIGAITLLLRAPASVLATAATGWLASLVVLAPAIWALGAVWETTRAAFLATTSISDLLAHAELLIVAALLAAVVFLALMLGGLASALRGAAWSVEALRQQAEERV